MTDACKKTDLQPRTDSEKLFDLVLASSIHDMKNSIGMLIGKLDAIGNTRQEKQSDCTVTLPDLQFESQRVHHHLMQLLTIYRIQNQQYSLVIDEHNINEMLAEITVPLRQLLAQKDITLEVHCTPELYAFFDIEMISGIISNVVTNAWRYAKNKVQISATMNENQELTVNICDDGEGYPDSMLDNIGFEQNKLEFQSGGTGLGLYFSSVIASMHKNQGKSGYIIIDNNGLSGGARLKLLLP